MLRQWRTAAVLAVLAYASWAPPSAAQTFGLYDDFNSGPLDPRRWLAYEYAIDRFDSHPEALYGTPDWQPHSWDPANLNSLRRVVGGQAQIALTSYRGFSGALIEYGAKARSGLRINHVALSDHKPVVTALRATVTVISASVPTGPPWCYGSDVGIARAELFGHFFNDGTGTGPDDLRGDVFAFVGLARRVESSDSGEVVRNVMVFGMGHCNNADCSRVRGGGAGNTFGSEWTIGVPYVVSIVWQPASNAFVFTVAGGGATESRTVPYTKADTTPARGYAYDLRVETRPRRCYSGSGQPPYQVPQEVSIDARFDNVRLNSSAATATR